jgi:hypothetical protein
VSRERNKKRKREKQIRRGKGNWNIERKLSRASGIG